MRYLVGLTAGGLIVLLWVLVTAACSDAATGPRPTFAETSAPTVTATCGTLQWVNDSQVRYTAPSSGPCLVIARDSTGSDTATVLVASASIVGGVPFGPFQLWSGSAMVTAPGVFTGSQQHSDPASIVQQISNARAAGQHLVLVLTGGGPSLYMTNGAFDRSKWSARLRLFNTSAIRTAIAAGVADGTVLGNSLMDEPEHKNWNGSMSKALLDDMAAESHALFPTLPVGPSHGPTGYYQWQPTVRYRVVDYVLNQYNYWVTNGNAVTYRDKVLAQAALDGVPVLFSLNILDGGQPAARDGLWACPTGTSAGRGTYDPACRMTSTQIRDWGRVLGPKGCGLLMWRYDAAAVSDAGNRTAFADVAASLAGVARIPCRRT